MAFKQKGTEPRSLSPSSNVFLSIIKIEPVSFWIQFLSRTHISVEDGHSAKIWIIVSGTVPQTRQRLFSDFLILCSRTFGPNILWMILYCSQIIWLSEIVLKHIECICCHSLEFKLTCSCCSHFFVCNRLSWFFCLKTS